MGRYSYTLQLDPHGSFRPVFADFLSESVAAAETDRSMILLGSTSPRMTRWAHDAAARVARPVSRRPAVALWMPETPRCNEELASNFGHAKTRREIVFDL